VVDGQLDHAAEEELDIEELARSSGRLIGNPDRLLATLRSRWPTTATCRRTRSRRRPPQ
jgi:hypothetical protein